MKLYRISYQDEIRFAFGDGDILRLATSATPETMASASLTPIEIPLADAKILAPMLPTKIVAIGRNYAEHAKELGNEAPVEPLIFLKPATTVIGTECEVEMPSISQRVDFEGELAIVISRRARRVPRSRWRDYVLGFTCANDVTARDLQRKDVQFTRAKSFDTFCPLGPCIVTDLDASDLRLRTLQNGSVRQDSRTSQLIFPIDHLVEYVTRVMTLEAGDVILTGTPAGVGPVVPGDVVEVEIEGIGTLRNSFVPERE